MAETGAEVQVPVISLTQAQLQELMKSSAKEAVELAMSRLGPPQPAPPVAQSDSLSAAGNSRHAWRHLAYSPACG